MRPDTKATAKTQQQKSKSLISKIIITLFIMGLIIGTPISEISANAASGVSTVYQGVDYSAVYNFNYYVSKYPDIKKAFNGNQSKTFNHFIKYGMKEGRQASADFNVQIYKQKYADLQKAFGNNLPMYYTHYVKYGKKEGRTATDNSSSMNYYKAVFDATFYANKYADLKKAFGTNKDKLFTHFLKYGMKEGRQASKYFNLSIYKSNYSDLRKAFGNDNEKYYQHFIKYGQKEKRNAVTLIKQAHTHKFNLVSTVNATCTNTGKKTYKCSCGQTKTETISAKGHNYNCETTEPTCDKDGKKVYTCKNCGKSYSETISTKGHSWGAEWTEEEVIGNAIEQTHYFGYNGVDLSLTYNIWSDSDYNSYCYEHGLDFSGGGYGTRLVLYFPNGQYVITTTYRKCSVCNKTEVVKTEKAEIHAPGYY